jgi:hypothetical protein
MLYDASAILAFWLEMKVKAVFLGFVTLSVGDLWLPDEDVCPKCNIDCSKSSDYSWSAYFLIYRFRTEGFY